MELNERIFDTLEDVMEEIKCIQMITKEETIDENT